MNEEVLIISALLRGARMAELMKHKISSKDFSAYREEMQHLERHPTATRATFKAKFPDFPLKKVGADELDDVVKEFKDRKAKYALSRSIDKAIEGLDSMSAVEIAEFLQAQSDLVLKTHAVAAARDIISDWGSIYQQAKEREAAVRSGKLVGIPTSIVGLDTAMGGLLPGELIIILGFQGEGKSWVQAEMATSAIIHQKRVLYVSLEMPNYRVAARFHTMLSAMISGKKNKTFPNMALETGNGLKIKQYRSFLKDVSRKFTQGFYVVDNDVTGMAELEALVYQFKPDVVFWDYLGIFTGGDSKNVAGWEAIGREASLAKRVAMKYNIPVVVAAQANRSGATDRDATPGLMQMARSYMIGQNADRVIGIRMHKPKEGSENSTMRISLVKNRYGAPVDLECRWNINYGIFKEIEQPKSDL